MNNDTYVSLCDFCFIGDLPFESGFVSKSLPTILKIARERIFSSVPVHMIGEGLSAPKFKAACFTHNLFILLLLFSHFFLNLWVHQGTFAEKTNVS